MPELITVEDTGVIILIQDNILNILESHRQLTTNSPEAGGILIGEYRGENINIVDITEPSKNDQRSRYRFFRRSHMHQTRATKIWIESGKTKTFIGDWHTHAEDHPTPSSIDTNDWRRKFRKRPMVVIIQGRISRWYGYWNGRFLLKTVVIK